VVLAIASAARDDETIRAAAQRWLRAHEPALLDGTVEPISRPAAGLSSDTCFVGAVTPHGERYDYVVRLPPDGEGLFPEYDLRRQVDRQNSLARRGIPIAAPVRFEADESWLGAPFMVMPRVPGHVLARSWLRKGLIAERSPGFRRELVLGFVRTVAALHRLPVEPVRSGQSTAGVGGGSLDDAFSTWSDYLDWASGDREPPAFIAAARDWCGDHLPRNVGPDSELWGDVQLTNAVFSAEGSVAALLDWEMSGVGPAELDLGWFLALHEMTIEQAGTTLPGIPTRTEIIECYETARGQSLGSLRWFEVFALMRSGSIMVRMARILSDQGVDDSWLVTHNPTQAALDRLV
jgi:aminoglycoside phosphotransferase (APT) family kinase protein